MPRLVADWWASFSQGSDHPSSAFNCSKSYRMASRCWWARCGHLTESRLFVKEQKVTAARGWAWGVSRSSRLVTEKRTNLEGTGISREPCICFIDHESTAKSCWPAWAFLGLTVQFLWQWCPRHLLCSWKCSDPFKSQVAICLECGCHDWETDFFFFFSFCFVFIILNLNRVWD